MRTSLVLASLVVAVSGIGSGCDSDGPPPPPLADYFEATPYTQAACNAVDDRLVGERPMRLFYSGSVQMLPVTQGLASYYHRHSLSFVTPAQPARFAPLISGEHLWAQTVKTFRYLACLRSGDST